MSLAKKLIKAASRAGADYVKFQTFKAESMIRKNTKLTIYQKKNLKKNLTQYDILKKYKLRNNWYESLILYSKKNNIKLISSPFDIKSIQLIDLFNFDYIKFPSTFNNLPYLKVLAKQKKKLILSN